MPTDFFALLHRDHTDLQQELTQLLDPAVSLSQLRSSLDGVRLGLVAHAEAEDIVLGRFDKHPSLALLVNQTRAAHRAQEAALTQLVLTRPSTRMWRRCAYHLRELVAHHAIQEAQDLQPALRELAAEYPRLAGAFATERLQQLAMLQPSAPVYSLAAAY
ncbi:MAG: hemerythrin domain-containing protein [Kofleriaceae bacterium]